MDHTTSTPAQGCLYDVSFRVPGARGLYFAPFSTPIEEGRLVLVSTGEHQRIGTVHKAHPKGVALGEIVRVLSLEEHQEMQHLEQEEDNALHFCRERVHALELPMKVVAVETEPHNRRTVFYFSSADRVDFRMLVKDLARQLHTRIELRQMGVRDATRYVGGIGLCGRKTCCSTFLPVFQPISIRMAKDQNLALNQDKLSGICGRLRCCLQYEQDLYQETRKGLPKLGKRVITPLGEGRVKDVNVLQGKIRVQITADNTFHEFTAQDIQPISAPHPAEDTDVSPETEEQGAVYKKKKRKRKKSPLAQNTKGTDHGNTDPQ
jgi:cell fate regulator YaaT (PSP1 superfamily)